MKKLFFTFAIFAVSLSAYAENNPFDETVQDCVKEAILTQHETFKQFQLTSVLTFAANNENFEYLIYLEKDGKVIDRLFIAVKESNFSNASLKLVGLETKKLNLQGCF